MAGTKGNSGGKRAGAGRKPAYMLAETQVKNMLRTAKKRAKEEGKTLDDILLDIIYLTGKDQIRDKIAAIKLFKDFTMQKSSEQNINVTKTDGPAIGLPEMRDDPALKIVPKKKQGTAKE